MNAPAVVLIPIRSFDDAKTRLAPVLTAADRRRLAQAMAERVVRAARDLPVRVVSDDADVARWARRLGAGVIAPGVSGLNPSIQRAAEIARTDLRDAAGTTRLIVAHADLPHAVDLRVVTGLGVAIAPDRHRDGSNVLSLPATAPFTFRYGPGSFAAHEAEAATCGLEFTVIDEPSLGFDVDDPSDLAALAAADESDRSARRR